MRRPFPPHSLTLLALGLPCLGACTEKNTPAPAAGAETASTSAPVAAPHKGQDPMDLFLGEGPRVQREFTSKVLGFEMRNQGLPDSGTWIGYPLLRDFNGDGRADLVASNREEDGYSAWESGADGSWILRNAGPEVDGVAGPGLPRDMQYGPAAAADVDGDGDVDLLVAAHSDALRVYLNDGAMRWTRADPERIQNAFLMLDIATGNLNGDEFVDVAGIAHFDGGLSLKFGDGKGGFTRLPESSAILPARTMGKAIQLVDMNGDGIDDVLVACNAGLKVILVHAGEPMSFEDISTGLPNPAIGNSIYSVVAGRFRPGAWPQVACCILANPLDKGEARDYVGVYEWDAEQRRWNHIDSGLERDATYRDLVAADFNRDGHLDLLTISLERAAVIWLGDGKGGFTEAGRLEGTYNKGRATVGDIDGDGWVDVCVAVPATKESPQMGGLRCYRNRPEIWK